MSNVDTVIFNSKFVTGLCVTIVAGLIFWLCSATVSYGTRISVLESSYEYIQTDLGELKGMIQKLTDEVKKQ